MKNNNFSSIVLTANCFNAIIEQIQEKFKRKHNLKELPKAFQLFGYGSFDEKKPSLKIDFEAIGTEFINGKYLYDKTRSVSKGKPTIKLNSYYTNIIFLYLGIENISEFLNSSSLSKSEKEAQEKLLKTSEAIETYYYVNYYFGEDNRILKGQTIISDNFKKIKHTYLYPDSNNKLIEYYNFGNIIRREDTLHLHTKTLLDDKIVEGGGEIYYIGHNDPGNLNFILGTYCAFDIYTHIVAGKLILEKYNSKEEMIKEARSSHIPAYIAQEIRGVRITNKNLVPNSFLELSNKSPYSAIYNKLPGIYELELFKDKISLGMFKFKIAKNTYKISPIDENVYIDSDKIDLINKGSIVHFSFHLAGIILFDKLDIYIKTYYLNDTHETQEGAFSGVDNENRLISGEVSINWNKI